MLPMTTSRTSSLSSDNIENARFKSNYKFLKMIESDFYHTDESSSSSRFITKMEIAEKLDSVEKVAFNYFNCSKNQLLEDFQLSVDYL